MKDRKTESPSELHSHDDVDPNTPMRGTCNCPSEIAEYLRELGEEVAPHAKTYGESAERFQKLRAEIRKVAATAFSEHHPDLAQLLLIYDRIFDVTDNRTYSRFAKTVTAFAVTGAEVIEQAAGGDLPEVHVEIVEITDVLKQMREAGVFRDPAPKDGGGERGH